MTEKIPDTPDLAELMRLAFQSMMSGVHVALPGKIQTWDPIEQRADIKPLIKRVFYTFERDRQVEDLPVIPKVPVLFPRSTEMFITFPLKKNDHVLLLFNERSIDQFMAKDKIDPDPATDPLDVRKFDLSDAVAFAGFYPDAKKLVDVDPDNLVIGRDEGVQIHITPTDEILLGSKTASEAVAIASRCLTELQAIVDAIKGGVPVAMDGGAALQTSIVALLNDPVPSVASTVAKLKANP